MVRDRPYTHAVLQKKHASPLERVDAIAKIPHEVPIGDAHVSPLHYTADLEQYKLQPAQSEITPRLEDVLIGCGKCCHYYSCMCMMQEIRHCRRDHPDTVHGGRQRCLLSLILLCLTNGLFIQRRMNRKMRRFPQEYGSFKLYSSKLVASSRNRRTGFSRRTVRLPRHQFAYKTIPS